MLDSLRFDSIRISSGGAPAGSRGSGKREMPLSIATQCDGLAYGNLG